MPSTYIPRRDIDLNNWLGNFAALIAAAPTDYGLSDADAVVIGDAVAAWRLAFTAAIAPSTRTRPAVRAKDEQRASVLKVVRGYAGRIRADAAVDGALKIGLGLHVRSAEFAPRVTPLGPPATRPVISLVGLRTGSQTLRIGDESSSTRRAKPAGVAGLLLFRVVADEPVREPGEAQFLAMVTRNAFESRFELGRGGDRGKTATYFARWANNRGEVGPWSSPASMPIAA